MSKKFKNQVCVYCANDQATSKDHVFARKFFLPQHRSNLLQAPACDLCNGEKANLENYLACLFPFGRLEDLRERLHKFGLELHPDKTRRIEFGRFAEVNRSRRGEGKPETFDFLAFTHISGKYRNGSYALKRKTVGKRMRAKLLTIKQQLRRCMHKPIAQTGPWLRSIVQGYFNYHAAPGNTDRLSVFRYRVIRLWRTLLIHRGQKHNLTWVRMRKLADRWIPQPRVLHPYPRVRFVATHSR